MWGWLKLLLARVAACGAQREVNRLRKPLLQGLAPLDEVAAVSLADPCEFPARPLRFDKLVVMAGFDSEDAWDMDCSIDMEDCEPPGEMEFRDAWDDATREFEEFHRADVELPLTLGADEHEVSRPGNLPAPAKVCQNLVFPDSTKESLEESSASEWVAAARADQVSGASLNPPGLWMVTRACPHTLFV